ncbi:glycosyltransferase [Bacteroides sp.]|uniref:glycosyltransferase family 2 protein n=1 Tax=Bacteroides sp. TaxID=29523 RepID=UPI00258E1AE2|nr:glycosyltransferase [Bacteroides sp.]
MPKISIIVPVFNAEKTLDRLLESILKQTFKDFELILVDDCSTDRSREICEKWAVLDSRIRTILKDENQGVSVARNIGLDIASGSYVMFADSDDDVDENWCKELYDARKKYSNALIVSNFYDVDDSGYKSRKIPCGVTQSVDCISDYYVLFKMHLSGSLWNKIFDLNILNTNNIRFVKGQYTGEDVVFIINYIKYCSSYVYLDKPLYYYYANPQSVLHTYHEDDLLQNLHLFVARLSVIEQKDWAEYCDIYFSYLVGLFPNILDPRCKRSFFQKMRYNQYVMKSKEFKLCVENMSGKNESAFFLRIVKFHNYYLLWTFQRLSCLVRDIIKI